MSKIEELSKEYVRPFLDPIYKDYGEHRQLQLSRFDGYDIMSASEEGANAVLNEIEAIIDKVIIALVMTSLQLVC